MIKQSDLYRQNAECPLLFTNNGHQDHGYVSLVPIGRLVAFDHRSGVFLLKKVNFLPMNQPVRAERGPEI